MISKGHSERAHSKFSASGADRWFNCPGSVELSEGVPDKPNAWAQEGTEAHEVLEKILVAKIENPLAKVGPLFLNSKTATAQNLRLGVDAAEFILRVHREAPGSSILIETRVYLDFIDPEMFGTFDGAVIDHFGTLHVFDYKFGVGPVSPVKNLQMLFYAIGVAHRFKWNFKRARMWIIQPRLKSYEGPVFWEISITELRDRVEDFEAAVERVKRFPKKFVEGSWCHWCRAKAFCPLKNEGRNQQAALVFSKVKK